MLRRTQKRKSRRFIDYFRKDISSKKDRRDSRRRRFSRRKRI